MENMENMTTETTEESTLDPRLTMEFRERKRWLFLGLPWTFTVYHIKADMLTIDTGCFSKQENDCYMYKIQDVQLTGSFAERLVGLGSVICYTGDTTHPTLTLTHIRHAKEIKDYILEMSEIQRIKRRTLNTVNIGAGYADADGDGIPDCME